MMRPSVNQIQHAVCEAFDITMADMVSGDRHRAVARPRQVAMYLAKRMTIRSYPELGGLFGGRDHTTIMHGVQTIGRLMEVDPELAGGVDAALSALRTQMALRRPGSSSSALIQALAA